MLVDLIDAFIAFALIAIAIIGAIGLASVRSKEIHYHGRPEEDSSVSESQAPTQQPATCDVERRPRE